MSALEMHHLDPMTKEVTLGSIMAHPIAWCKIIKELRKCVMVCSNHHKEIHSGMTEVPSDAPRFDEEYADKNWRRESWNQCPICEEPKPPYRITCSRKCAAIKARSVKWDDTIIEVMRSNGKNWEDISDYFGVSNMAVQKRYKKTHRDNKRECAFCDSEFEYRNANQKYCSHKCSRLSARKCTHPTKPQLKEDISSMSWVAIGKKYGVSDNACRKWARKYGLII